MCTTVVVVTFSVDFCREHRKVFRKQPQPVLQAAGVLLEDKIRGDPKHPAQRGAVTAKLPLQLR